jgi:hypothetical protein
LANTNEAVRQIVSQSVLDHGSSGIPDQRFGGVASGRPRRAEPRHHLLGKRHSDLVACEPYAAVLVGDLKTEGKNRLFDVPSGRIRTREQALDTALRKVYVLRSHDLRQVQIRLHNPSCGGDVRLIAIIVAAQCVTRRAGADRLR